jgi:alpha-L-fucosidase
MALFVIQTFTAFSQENDQPSEGNLEARKWFQDARFGIFIHWGDIV